MPSPAYEKCVRHCLLVFVCLFVCMYVRLFVYMYAQSVRLCLPCLETLSSCSCLSCARRVFMLPFPGVPCALLSNFHFSLAFHCCILRQFVPLSEK